MRKPKVSTKERKKKADATRQNVENLIVQEVMLLDPVEKNCVLASVMFNGVQSTAAKYVGISTQKFKSIMSQPTVLLAHEIQENFIMNKSLGDTIVDQEWLMKESLNLFKNADQDKDKLAALKWVGEVSGVTSKQPDVLNNITNIQTPEILVGVDDPEGELGGFREATENNSTN